MRRDWNEINKFHGLPKFNGYGKRIIAGEKYYLLSAEGDSLDRTQYLCIGLKGPLAHMETLCGGFSFVIDMDALSKFKPPSKNRGNSKPQPQKPTAAKALPWHWTTPSDGSGQFVIRRGGKLLK